jgi:hypothetical protein
MKDSEFIELLNLYLDHEIPAEDASRLEKEVLRSPARRRIYREYCQMQKGCELLGESVFATDSVEAASARRASAWAAGTIAVGVLAAACVTFGMFMRSQSGTTPVLVRAQAADKAPSVAASAPFDDGLKLVFAVNSLAPVGARTVPSLATLAQEDPLAWMNRVQFAPIQGLPDSALRLDPTQALSANSKAPAAPSSSDAGQIEMTAFRFQR